MLIIDIQRAGPSVTRWFARWWHCRRLRARRGRALRIAVTRALCDFRRACNAASSDPSVLIAP
jgi:hypothetical protein